MNSERDKIVNLIWFGNDPFVGFPETLYERDAQGWHSNHSYLTTTIDRLKASPVIVEVGVWKGASVITMANKLRELDQGGVVIAIDTWLGSWDHWCNPSWFRELAISGGRPSMQNKFMANVVYSKLTDYVVPLPLDSINAVNVIRRRGIAPNMVHIDGGHDYSAVMSDLVHWWPVLSDGGFLIGDDYGDGNWPDVTRAFDDFFRTMTNVIFEHEHSKCRVQKLAA
jgi:hypothetical protein